MRDKMCNECKRCDGDLCNYFDNYSDRESTLACILFEPKKPTVFDYITQSEEKLAETLVYMRVVSWDDEVNWYSVVLRSYCFRTKEEAIAATLEELKKEVEE